jgi:hypothetical protein
LAKVWSIGCCDRITAPCLFDGPIKGKCFRAYVQQILVPQNKAGDIVIMEHGMLPFGWSLYDLASACCHTRVRMWPSRHFVAAQ